MIKINLTPKKELENPMWFVPDVAVAVLVCLLCFFGVSGYLGHMREQAEALVQETREMRAEGESLQPSLKRLDAVAEELRKTNDKLYDVRPLAFAKSQRYKSIVALEMLQNLKPAGLWFKTIDFSSEDAGQVDHPLSGKEISSAKITGFAYDNLSVAEYLAALRATQAKDVDAKNVRTQVYFDRVRLISSLAVPMSKAVNGGYQSRHSQRDQAYQFEIDVHFTQRVNQDGFDLHLVER